MIEYADYKYYLNSYKGDMSEFDFKRLLIKASAIINNHIFNRDITGYEEEVQIATCSVIDILYNIENINAKVNQISNESNKIVASESVGDLSRTFANFTIIDLNNEIANQKNKIEEEIRTYLLSTGLLYRGI